MSGRPRRREAGEALRPGSRARQDGRVSFGFHDFGHDTKVLECLSDLLRVFRIILRSFDQVRNSNHHSPDLAQVGDGLMSPLGKACLLFAVEQTFNKTFDFGRANHA